VYAPSGRAPTASINFITAHDGFTLRDLVSYAVKHNEANGENNRDGAEENFSANYGVEGESNESAVRGIRLRQRRNLIATLLFSEGIPMLTAGDEFGRTQSGNNNAYCQDNETSWVDWDAVDRDFMEFVRRLLQLRLRFPVFRRSRFFSGGPVAGTGRKDIAWLLPDGRELSGPDWHGTSSLGVSYALEEAETGNRGLLLLVSPSSSVIEFALPPGSWRCLLDTARDIKCEEDVVGRIFALEGQSLALLVCSKPG
jgi:glycogen operon protein